MREVAELNKEMFTIKGKHTRSVWNPSADSSLSFWQDAWRRLRKNRAAFVGLVALSCCMRYLQYLHQCSVIMDFQPWIRIRFMQDRPQRTGLDVMQQVRDLWVRTWMGARTSLTIGLLSAFINMCVGAVIGGLCGYYGGKLDMIVMRIVDVLYGIPSLIITILVMIVLGKGITCLIVAMCIVGWIGTCRFVRGEVYRLKEQDFVMAARVLGMPDIVIILRHIIPNILGMMVTNLCMAIPNAIFQEAFLSYIGLGYCTSELWLGSSRQKKVSSSCGSIRMRLLCRRFSSVQRCLP